MTNDIIMAASSLLFVVALVVQFVDGFRRRVGGVSPWMSGPTCAALFAMTCSGLGAGFVFAPRVWQTCAILWGVILWQRVHYGPPARIVPGDVVVDRETARVVGVATKAADDQAAAVVVQVGTFDVPADRGATIGKAKS